MSTTVGQYNQWMKNNLSDIIDEAMLHEYSNLIFRVYLNWQFSQTVKFQSVKFYNLWDLIKGIIWKWMHIINCWTVVEFKKSAHIQVDLKY